MPFAIPSPVPAWVSELHRDSVDGELSELELYNAAVTAGDTATLRLLHTIASLRATVRAARGMLS